MMPNNLGSHWAKEKLKNHRNAKYLGVDRYALQNFKCCHGRVRDGKVKKIQWPLTKEGYLAFCKEIGSKPDNKRKWSVGRINHKKGYVAGNIQWEEHRLNSVKRNGTKYVGVVRADFELDKKVKVYKRGSKKHSEFTKLHWRKYWSYKKNRLQRSKKMQQLWAAGVWMGRKRRAS